MAWQRCSSYQEGNSEVVAVAIPGEEGVVEEA